MSPLTVTARRGRGPDNPPISPAYIPRTPWKRRSPSSSWKRSCFVSLPTNLRGSYAPPSSASPGAAPSPTPASAAASMERLGFLNQSIDKRISHFIPTTASSFSLTAPDRRIWRAGRRLPPRPHRALFLSRQGLLLVWEPITGAERDLINALKTRIRSHGEVALDCASTDCGCALLYKGQAMNHPLDNIPKSASNEESVTGATSKEDAGNSKTSDSNVEDAVPP